MLAYFSRALALDPTTGNVKEGLEEYEWDETQMKLLLTGKWLEMDLVNRPGDYTSSLRSSRITNSITTCSPKVTM